MGGFIRRRLSVLLAAFLAPLLAASGFTLWSDTEAGADDVTQTFACFTSSTNRIRPSRCQCRERVRRVRFTPAARRPLVRWTSRSRSATPWSSRGCARRPRLGDGLGVVRLDRSCLWSGRREHGDDHHGCGAVHGVERPRCRQSPQPWDPQVSGSSSSSKFRTRWRCGSRTRPDRGTAAAPTVFTSCRSCPSPSRSRPTSLRPATAPRAT